MPARQRNIWKIKTSLLILSGPGAVMLQAPRVATSAHPPWDRSPLEAGALEAGQDRFHNDKQQAARTEIQTAKTRTLLPNKIIQPHRNGGAGRDRTDDILLAKQALSQLSYGPKSGVANEWWAWKDLNFRPHAYQARALTN
jgi:hypothetical protein